MNPSDRDRVKDLLNQAANLDPHQRKAFIESAASGNDEIAAEVFDLLRTLDDSFFMSSPTGAGFEQASAQEVLREGPGAKIGRYKLLQLIGEGGFGSVFMAEQSEPVQRRVALKIIKAGMDTKQVIARFEAERQALAMMDHPNIARVLDAGATDTGRPYFVMELVRGEPVTGYCDGHQMAVEDRLELFRDVCNAVQHAHQKGIIHRDIKPSNVMVTIADGKPVPKVIDFGIAKATAARLTDKTLFTEMHQLIGTPEYMSPEQAEVSGVDIDTRSDVYSLGVLLYELLAGSTPIERGRLRSTPLAEIQRLIREEEPPRPSLRLAAAASASGATFKTPLQVNGESSNSSVIEIARRRQLEPLQLTRTIRGDLDWIVMKCLEKDRSRRYATASALADDIGRYLTNQPVLATPPSRTYKFRKFVARNRTVVVAGTAVFAALVLGVIGTTVGLVRVVREQDRTQQQRLIAEENATKAQVEAERANREAKQTRDVAEFQEKMLAGIDPQTMGVKIRDHLLAEVREAANRSGRTAESVNSEMLQLERLINETDLTGIALAVLDENIFQRALLAIDKQFADQPLLKARLLQVSADTLQQLGLFDAAIGPQLEALAIRRRLLGDKHADTLYSIGSTGYLLQSQGKLEEAESYLREALNESRRVLGVDHPDTLTAMNYMGLLLQAQGRLEEAELHYRETLENRRHVLGDEHPETLSSLNNMGFFLQAQGKLAEAEPYFREALEKLRHVMGPDDLNTLVALNNMGALLYAQGKLTEAETYFHEAIDTSRRVLGEEHHDLLRAMDNMGVVLRAQGRLADAESYCRESLEKHRRVLGDEHPDTIISMGNMGVLLQAEGKPSEAEPFLQAALETSSRVLGDDNPDTLRARSNLGQFLQSEGRLAEAEPQVRETLERRRRVLGDEHPHTLLSITNMGGLLLAQGKFSEAEPYCREAVEKHRSVLGDDNQNTLVAITRLGALLEAQGKPLEAIALLVPAEPGARHSFTGGNASNLGRLLTPLGCARVATKDFVAAETNLIEAHALLVAASDNPKKDISDVISCLVSLYDNWSAASADNAYIVKAAEWRANLHEASTQPGQ